MEKFPNLCSRKPIPGALALAILACATLAARPSFPQERVNRPLRLFGAGGTLQAAASPDGSRIAAASGSSEIRVVSGSTGRQLLLFGRSGMRARSVAYSPDGKVLATGGTSAMNGPTVILWDASTGAELRSLDVGGGIINRVAFSPDGATLAAGGVNSNGTGRLLLWETATWTPLPAPSFPGEILALSFSGDGSRLAVASTGTAKVIALPSGQEISAPAHSGICDAALSADGSRLALAYRDSTWGGAAVALFDAATGLLNRTLRCNGYQLWSQSVAFSSDGTLLALGIQGLGVGLWDPSTGASRGLLRPAFPEGSSGWVFPSIGFLQGGQTLLAASGAEVPGGVAGTVDRRLNLLTLFDCATALPQRSFPLATDSTVVCLVVSSDGARLAAGREDGGAEVWDTATGALVASLAGHTGKIWSIAFSPDGSKVLTGSDDRTAKLWDAVTGAEIRTLLGHTSSVRSVAFSPDGARVATGGFDSRAKIWSVSTGQELRSIDAGAVHGTVAFSPDGASLLTATWKYLRLWNASTGELVRTYEGSEGNLAAFTPDGGRIAVVPYPSSHGGTTSVRLLDRSTGATVKSFREGRYTGIYSMHFSPDGALLLLGTDAPSAELWDPSSGTLVRALPHNEIARGGGFSPDGLAFFTGCAATAFRWPTQGTDPQRMGVQQDAALKFDGEHAALSPDAKLAATADEQVARLWDTSDGRWLRDLKGHAGEITSLAFSPDGSKILTGSSDFTAKLWSASSGELVRTFKGHTASVNRAVFSPDGARILTVSEDGSGRLWDAQTGSSLQIFAAGITAMWAGSFSPDGKKVLLSSDRLGLYDAETGSLIWAVTGPTMASTFTPDGNRILADATLGYRCHIGVYDAATGERISATKIYDGMACPANLAMAPDGRHFAVALTPPKTTEIWDLSTMSAVSILDGHAGSVHSLSFSQDGTQVLTASGDTPALLWATALEPPAREAAPIVLGQTLHGAAAHLAYTDFKLALNPGEASNLKVRVVPETAAGTLSLLGRRASFPTLTLYDWRGEASPDGSLEMLVPSPGAGEFVISVAYENWASLGSGAFSITVEPVSRHVAGVTPSSGGNAGTTTVSIRGLGFENGVRVELRGGGAVLKSATPSGVEPDLLAATLDLKGLQPRTADLAVVWPDSGEKVLTGAFRITAGGAPKLEAHISVPSDVRMLRPATLWVEYENTGGTDMPAPVFIVVSDQGLLLRHDSSEAWVRAPLNFLGIDFVGRGTAGTLSPGRRYRVPLQFFPEGAAHTKFTFSLYVMDPGTSAVDWGAQEARFKPEWGVDPEAWGHIWAQFTASIGATWSDYGKALRAAADRLSAMGRFVSQPSVLLHLSLDRALAGEPRQALAGGTDASHPGPGLPLVFTRSYPSGLATRFALGPMGRGWTHCYDLSAREFENGDAAICGFGGFRSFAKDASGGYQGRDGDSGRLVRTGAGFVLTESNGSVYAFDGEGRLASIREYMGNQLTCAYDGSGRLVSVSHGDGDRLDLSYNSSGRLAQLTDAAGAATTYTFDGSGEHLVSVTAPGGRTVTYEYKAPTGAPVDHALTSITFPDGSHRNFAYDGSGRLSGMSRDGGAEEVSLTQEEVGKVSLTAAGSTFTFALDAAGNVGEAEMPGGTRTEIARDNAGSPVRVTDPAGGRWDLTYGPLGNVTSIRDPLGNSKGLEYTYPESGGARVVGVVDGNGNRATYERGAGGRGRSGGADPVSAIVYPDDSREEFLRDAQGMVSQYTNRRGQAILHTRNGRGQLTLKVFPDGTSTSYDYDTVGRLTKATDSTGDILLEYDGRGFLSKITYPGGHWFSFTANDAGKRTGRTGDDGFTLAYTYDGAGRLETVRDGGGAILVSYQYDAAGRVAREDRGNGTAVVTTYDPMGRPASVIHTGPGGAPTTQFAYTYDARGNPTSVTAPGGTTTYQYDGRGQLVGVQGPGGHQVVYTYDAAGNRTRIVDNGAPTDYIVNALNQVTGAGADSFAYDGDGNLASRTGPGGAATFQYDATNRLVRATDGLGSTSDLSYNALGALSSISSNGGTTNYLHDGGGVGAAATELSGAGQVLARAVEGLGLAGVVDASGAMAHFGFDGMGSTSQVTDFAGTLKQNYGYSAFGEVTSQTGSSPTPYQFGGRDGGRVEIPGLADMMTNLGRREYASSLGRCNSVSPLRFQGGSNLYSPGVENGAKSKKKVYGAAYKHDWTGDGLNLVGVLCDTKVIPEPIGGPLGHGLNLYSFGQGFDEMTQGAETGDWQAYSHGFGTSALVIMGYFGEICPPAQPIVKTAQAIAWVDETATDLYIKSLGTDDPSRWYVPHNKWWYLNHNNSDGVMPEWERKFYEKSAESDGRYPQDPNEKLATPGRGDQHIVTAQETLSYVIHFENMATASAPAQEVFVTDSLDANLDLSTLRFTGMGWATTTVDISTEQPLFSKRITVPDYRPDVAKLWWVDVKAELKSSGVIQWTFRTLDPETGELPEDALAGFLPPNDTTGRGEGWATFTVKSKAGLSHGTKITNRATIVFDVYASIDTNEVFNTIGPPPGSGSISGTVFLDTNGNGLRDPGETGLSGVTVTASLGRAAYTAITGSGGAYTLGGLDAGSYSMAVSASDPNLPACSAATNPNPRALVLADGQAATGTDFGFRATAAPSVSSANPARGATSGGTLVTITGADLGGATTVKFGGTPATNFQILSATQVSATTPPHAEGAVHVTVTTPCGTSPETSADLFTYAACSVTCTASASPDSGNAPLAVAFGSSATASGCMGTVAYEWLFGDGGISTLQNPSHTYTSQGTYTWVLTASADGGSCSQTGTLVVEAGCTYALSPASKAFAAKAGSANVTITAAGLDTCGAPAVSASEAWVGAVVTKFAKNKGKVKVSVQANPSGAPRNAQVQIGGGIFAVSQAGAACKINALSPSQATVPGTGGEGSFAVSATGDCAWTVTGASSAASWLAVTSAPGSGPGAVTYSAAPNTTGKSRKGTLTVATGSSKKTFTLTQGP